MKQTIRILGLVTAGLLVLCAAPAAMAAGTASGTSIQNTATVDYAVGGFPQAQIVSNSADFVVDNRIDLTVTTTDAAAVTVLPGSTAMALNYLLTNTGNTVQDFRLQAINAAAAAFGLTESFDAANVNVFVDVNGNGVYEPAIDTATYVDELAADAAVAVFVVSDVLVTQLMGDVASYDLLATTAVGGTGGALGADATEDAGADDPALVQVVFGDGAGSIDVVEDGQFSSLDSYEVADAVLAITKAMAVVEDPFNGVVNPKAVPGARVTYTLDLGNTGVGGASNVAVVDAIPANTGFVVGSVVSTGTATYSDDGGVTWVAVPAPDANGTDLSITHLQVVFALLAGGATEQAAFDVLIQ